MAGGAPAGVGQTMKRQRSRRQLAGKGRAGVMSEIAVGGPTPRVAGVWIGGTARCTRLVRLISSGYEQGVSATNSKDSIRSPERHHSGAVGS